MKVVELHSKSRADKIRASLEDKVNEVPHDADGFVIAWFRRDGDEIHHNGAYFVHDPADLLVLTALLVSSGTRILR